MEPTTAGHHPFTINLIPDCNAWKRTGWDQVMEPVNLDVVGSFYLIAALGQSAVVMREVGSAGQLEPRQLFGSM